MPKVRNGPVIPPEFAATVQPGETLSAAQQQQSEKLGKDAIDVKSLGTVPGGAKQV